MPARLQRYVADNTERIRRVDTRSIRVDGERRQRELTFSATITVDLTVEVYTRDLTTGLISGHPNAKHGSGRGEAGDIRGSWSSEFSTVTTKVFTRNGRNAVRDALDGQAGAFTDTALGTDSTAAAVDDTALGTETDEEPAWPIKDSGNEARARSGYRFHEHPDTVEEYGVKDGDGDLMVRATETLSTSDEQEVRVDVTFTVTGTSPGDMVLTDNGETAIADSLGKDNVTTGLNEIAFGTGTTTFSESDTGLTTEEYRKNCQRILEDAYIVTRMWTASDEPSGVTASGTDLSEIEVTDNNSKAVFLATFNPFTKTNEFSFLVEVDFRIR